mmetsp:Transcript_36933/g.78787  ORF Transcript_36933/g.78787 Transcript_36933/m.78787 type:complete len:86 (-) Transcript_36933:458-715(-)
MTEAADGRSGDAASPLAPGRLDGNGGGNDASKKIKSISVVVDQLLAKRPPLIATPLPRIPREKYNRQSDQLLHPKPTSIKKLHAM